MSEARGQLAFEHRLHSRRDRERDRPRQPVEVPVHHVENNGGAFVLVYLVCIAAVGLPIMMAELLIGRATQKSMVGAFKEAIGPAWGIVGLWGVLCGFLLLSYYTVIAGWSLFYFAKSAGWLVGGFPAGASMGELFGAQAANGGLQLGLSLGFSIATVSIVYCGVQKGIERIARVFLPILFGILVLLLVSALEMAGAGEALGFIFRPRFGELDGGSVLEALGHRVLHALARHGRDGDIRLVHREASVDREGLGDHRRARYADRPRGHGDHVLGDL